MSAQNTEEPTAARKSFHSTYTKRPVHEKIVSQINLLIWKRYRETIKNRWEIAKLFMPPILFFSLILLIYGTLDLFYPDGVEPFLVPLAFWIFIQRVVVQIMYEKSMRLQESMRMMGLSDLAYWVSYFVAEGVVGGFILSFICAILSTGGLFNDANFGVILGFLFVFCLSAVPFCFFLCAFFDTPQTSGQATLGILLGMYVLYVVIFTAGSGTISLKSAQIVCSLFPPLGLQIGSGLFLNSVTNSTKYTGIYIADVCGILFADIFIYCALAWYFSQVWPSKVGVRKPWYFIFRLNYWMPEYAASRSLAATAGVPATAGVGEVVLSETLMPAGQDKKDEEEGKQLDGVVAGSPRLNARGEPVHGIPEEPVDERLLGKPTVEVNKLRKTFGAQVAVNNLSFKMYENQIFALLGHNGAGKTTTINMLVGLDSPDYAGSDHSATIYGSSILTDMDAVRYSLGVCPQHDVLFENLTVREHILFFAQLKGKSYAEAEEEAVTLTDLFHLDQRLDHTGKELSGGQKRKLSVGIAVCGGSKFVVLDEPTAGMDPLARRELWDLLAVLREGRTMLLTTHYMDEADVLGDRVGIMSLGVMQCVGSTQFLKSTFGAGYKLIFDRGAGLELDNPGCTANVQTLAHFVQEHIPTAKLVEEDGGENQVQFNLPFETVGKFGALFTQLESRLETLHVSRFGVTITSLEDVFLKVGEDHTVTPHAGEGGYGIGRERAYKSNLRSQIIGIAYRKLSYAMNDFVTVPLLLLPVAAGVTAAGIYGSQVITDDDSLNDIVAGAIIAIGYIGAPGLLAEFIVRERENKLRNVLTVMGCDFRAYWLGTLIADYILLSIPLVAIWISWFAAGLTDFYAGSGGANFFVTVIFTFQLIGFSYFFAFAFQSPKSAISFFPILIILLLISPNVLLLIITQIATAVGTTISSSALGGILLWGIMITTPHGALYASFLDTTSDFSAELSNFPPVGASVAFMLVEAVVFFAFSYYTDMQSVVQVEPVEDPKFKPSSIANLDEDVQAERERTLAYASQRRAQSSSDGAAAVTSAIHSAAATSRTGSGPDNSTDSSVEMPQLDEEIGKPQEGEEGGWKTVAPASPGLPPLLIERLRKVFPPTVPGKRSVTANEDCAFMVEAGEIFGLLGANGAGKTTLLSMLTRHLIPTSGDARITGYSILQEFTQGATHLGVVTQSNSLWGLLSVEDHLYLFARLRGVPEDLVKKVVEGTIDQLELTPHKKKLAMRLSGGMQRKLCVAIALIGDPEVVLLDEPSAGLDPVSRRNLWSVILRTMSNRAVILTTHSMDEAEALCKRIGIMVQGQLRALGSKQHLKNKFGSGFELVVKVHFTEMDKQRAELTSFVQSLFPAAELMGENGGLLTFRIPKEEMKLGLIFMELEKNKAELQIEDYSVAQPTLEQVFIRTVNKFTPAKERDPLAGNATVIGGSARMSVEGKGMLESTHGEGDARHSSASSAEEEEAFIPRNKCGCTNFQTKVMTGVASAFVIIFLALSFLFAASNRAASSGMFVVAFFALVVAVVGCNLLCCACCQPPKGADD